DAGRRVLEREHNLSLPPAAAPPPREHRRFSRQDVTARVLDTKAEHDRLRRCGTADEQPSAVARRPDRLAEAERWRRARRAWRDDELERTRGDVQRGTLAILDARPHAGGREPRTLRAGRRRPEGTKPGVRQH